MSRLHSELQTIKLAPHRMKNTQLMITIGLLLFTPLTKAEIGSYLLASGFNQPVWAESPQGVSDTLWILEKPGRIQLFNTQTGKTSTFLDIRDQIKIRMNEQGLLGMAFSKDYLKSGRLYLYYTNLEGDTEIARYTAKGSNKQQCSPTSKELLLKIDQYARNHNGGWIGMGPDDYLYIATGDGGKANDPFHNGQSLSSHLGKILRIDVSSEKGYTIPVDNPFIHTPKALPEIYAYGLRNPWRCSFDEQKKHFYIADVGQNHWEEVNCVSLDQLKGANFGWRLREGNKATHKQNIGGERPPQAIDPVYTYKHGHGNFEGVSVTGGYAYRGPIKSLQGKYFFADFANPRIWSFEMNQGKATNFKNWTDQLTPPKGHINLIASFGQDHEGNLLIISHSGSIFKVTDQ